VTLMNNGMVVAFLINASWQIALVALAAAACARLMRGGRAIDEHRLWVAALIVAVALPVVSTIGLPGSPVSRFPGVRSGGRDQVTGQPGNRATPSNFSLPRTRIYGPPPNIALWIASAYALFLTMRALVLFRGWRRTAALRASATNETAPSVRAAAARCRDALAIDDVPLLVSRDAGTPVTIGNAIVLPPGIAEKLSEEALLAVIGHEMAHVRRRDFAINIVYELLYALIAFHPVAPLIRRRLSQSREQACDEIVAATLVKPVRYAHALLDVAAMLAPDAKPAWSLAMAERGFEERVLRLARPRRKGAYTRWMVAASCVLLACTVAVGVAFAVERVTPNAVVAQPGGSFATACASARDRDSRAIPSLLGLLGDETPVSGVRCYTRSWSPAISTFVQPTVGEASAMALAFIGSDSIDPLISQIDSPSIVVRRNAAWAIGEIRGGFLTNRSAAVQPLLRIIHDSDATVRRAAAFTFGELRSDDAIPPLIDALSDPDDAVRATAAWALGEIRAPDAVSTLERVAANDPNAKARAAARYALNEINGD